MNLKYFFVAAIVIFAINQSDAFNFGGCKAKGVDVCSCTKKLTPRPFPVQLPKLFNHKPRTICKTIGGAPPPQFKPIGDMCQSCGHQAVKPAPLPQRRCLLDGGNVNEKPNCPCQSCQQQQPQPQQYHEHKHEHVHHDLPQRHHEREHYQRHHEEKHYKQESEEEYDCGQPIRAPENYQGYHSNGAEIYFETKKKTTQAPKRYAPADVVSVSIAQRLANQAKAGANERHLQYGSVKEPINGYKIKSIKEIPEENLYKSNGNVLELKNYIFKNQEESSEESSEEEKPQKSKSSAFNPAALEFEDIGYNVAENPNNQYVVVTNNQPQSHSFSCNKSKKKNHHHHNRHFGKKSSCGCASDLLVEQSAISEQSTSLDNSSQEHHFST
ncbi:unnamed protein product [Diamesa tonsa]